MATHEVVPAPIADYATPSSLAVLVSLPTHDVSVRSQFSSLVHMPQALTTAQNLEALLREKYPEREQGTSEAVTEIARTLSSTGYGSLVDVAAMLDRNIEALLAEERLHPPLGVPDAQFDVVGVIRVCLRAERERILNCQRTTTDSVVAAEALETSGDLAGAERAYRDADATCDASLHLCRVALARRDIDASRRAMTLAVQRGHVTAIFDTGVILVQEGRLQEAEVAYRAADAAGDTDASCNLGILLEKKGDIDGAGAAYGRADRAGDGDAAACLGAMLEANGDLEGAQAAFVRASDRGQSSGAVNLGDLLLKQGDERGAELSYIRAEKLGAISDAAQSLGVLYARLGRFDEAEAALIRADSAGNPSARYILGLAQVQRGDMSAARRHLELARQAGHPRAAAAIEQFFN